MDIRYLFVFQVYFLSCLSVRLLMFTPDCVYNVCFHFCESMGPERSHSVVDKPQTAHSDFFYYLPSLQIFFFF